jgi:hypothetical protein
VGETLRLVGGHALRGRAKRRRIKQAQEDAAAARQQTHEERSELPATGIAAAAAAAVSASVLGDHLRPDNANGGGGGGSGHPGLSHPSPDLLAASDDPEAEFLAEFREVDPTQAVVLFSVHTNDGARNRLGFRRLLQTIRPQKIVLYEPDLTTMRQIEVPDK